jgi:anti-sigma regulatory factor (Ser/Thr protein kinase)
VGARVGARLDSATLLPPAPAAASAGRRFLRGTLAQLPEEVLDVVLLLASELVSNAVRHGTGEVRLCLETASAQDPHWIRVGVSDDNPVPPRLRAEVLGEHGLPAESGRGVLLLERLASRWGVTPEPPGKQVWFELDVPA